ncbi:hypothetical protein FPV67DRAFT_1428952, partial [Lyophyllum atratum]
DKVKEMHEATFDTIQKKLNPFDVEVTKLKPDVGGRKIRRVLRRPARTGQNRFVLVEPRVY